MAVSLLRKLECYSNPFDDVQTGQSPHDPDSYANIESAHEVVGKGNVNNNRTNALISAA